MTDHDDGTHLVTWRTARGTKRRQRFEPHEDGGFMRYEEIMEGSGWRTLGAERVTRLDIDAPETSDFLDLFPQAVNDD
jgi:hypothetical protein